MITEHLALALCLQLADEYSYLLERVGFQGKKTLTINNYKSAAHKIPQVVLRNSNARKLYNSIVTNYSKNVEFLKGRKYGYQD